ncbi:exopolysaccharide biosynthesis polyprenyl glycosylphosphotransferase [Novosphingobium sp. JCM 18896]|uniref:exopolysaccharide biosynthesis polyprenyl glycosylphosphotransferase n=1 Tax=Novosphingobium sp. JCM 18896 TaxID=2989731 RepID=UPI002222D6F7|nr:exopolysaccharide biosynthesis polyprenyl glycosylphosphotransferase [Novosphingobium sp. JCM 18896]MCW1431472.1 exopolysaccharide biosynthesis polyprenyl glycosylphosphotransferase [Novosphingobium sp. JCM 18896]
MTVQHQLEIDAAALAAIPNRAGGLSKKTLRLKLYIELFALDMFLLIAAPLVPNIVATVAGLPPSNFYSSTAIFLIYAILSMLRGGYSIETLGSSLCAVRDGLISLSMSLLIILMVAFFFKDSSGISRLNFGIVAVTSTFFLVLGRALFPIYARRAANGTLIDELIIVHGKAPSIERKGAVILDADRANLIPDLHDPYTMHLFGTVVSAFDRVLIDSDPEYHRAWALMLKGANINGEIFVEQANHLGAIGMGKFHGQDTLQVARQPLSLAHRMQKRMLDIAVSVPLIIALFVPMVLVAIAIKIDSPGPVFFRQQRVGRGNRLFEVLKFRSMKIESCDASGNRSTSRDDDRITRLGRFIRATSIDELPQLLNVLLGDMSLVGPRPHALGSLAGEKLFWQVDETYWLRHQLKPGITGLAQVRGLRGNTVTTSDLTDRLDADMEYIQGWNIWRDVAILVNTARVVWHPNAY